MNSKLGELGELFYMYDILIIGGSAAGMTSAIYAARHNSKAIIITKDIGGEIAMTGEVKNWLGIQSIRGFELVKNFREHVESYNVPIETGIEVMNFSAKDNYYIVKAKDGSGNEKTYEAKTIIIASGIHPRPLGVPGEEKLRGKGITYCTVCDGPLYRGKATATIGAGNSALSSAIMMAGFAKKVYLLTKFSNTKENNFGFPKGENTLIDKVNSLDNIETIYNATTKEVLGSEFVEGLVYFDSEAKEDQTIEVQGIMVHIGNVPNSAFAPEVKTDKSGAIEVNVRCETNLPGVFAAGDVTNSPYKQISIASGQGTIAALAAIDYVNRLG